MSTDLVIVDRVLSMAGLTILGVAVFGIIVNRELSAGLFLLAFTCEFFAYELPRDLNLMNLSIFAFFIFWAWMLLSGTRRRIRRGKRRLR